MAGNKESEGKKLLLEMMAFEPKITAKQLFQELQRRRVTIDGELITYHKLWNRLDGRTKLEKHLHKEIRTAVDHLAATRLQEQFATPETGGQAYTNNQDSSPFSPFLTWVDVPTKAWTSEGEDMFNLPSFLKGENRRTCRVKDDSLKPVLNKGQRMLLQVDDNPQEGMIVLACNATEAAIGYYEKVGDHYQLRPPNSNYPPIPIPEPEWIVIGYLVAKIPSVSERKGSITWDFDDGIRE